MVRFLRQMRHLLERTPPFLMAIVSSRGIISADGRQLLFGKMRRYTLSFFPSVALYFQKKYGLSGGCVSCGASCNLMFRCPHWDEKTHLCTVYEDRPNICRVFPITPGDIRDRDLILKDKRCGFDFKAGQE